MHIRDGTNTTKKNCFILFAFKPFWIIHNAYSWFGLEKKAWAFSIFVFSDLVSIRIIYLLLTVLVVFHEFPPNPKYSLTEITCYKLRGYTKESRLNSLTSLSLLYSVSLKPGSKSDLLFTSSSANSAAGWHACPPK